MINYQTVYRKLYKHLDTYSGSKFIKMIQESDPSLPDFDVYIELRRKEGKSTLRKDYFKDIILSYPDLTKIKLFEIFLKHYEKLDREDAKAIRLLLEDNN